VSGALDPADAAVKELPIDLVDLERAPEALAGRIALTGAIGIRYLIVRGHGDVDDRRVVDNLAQLPALRCYVATMPESPAD